MWAETERKKERKKSVSTDRPPRPDRRKDGRTSDTCHTTYVAASRVVVVDSGAAAAFPIIAYFLHSQRREEKSPSRDHVRFAQGKTDSSQVGIILIHVFLKTTEK